MTEMAVEKEEWEGEEESGGLKLRSRKPNAGIPSPKEDRRTSVYLDTAQGIWKCHHCIWTYRMGSSGLDHHHNHEECSNWVNAKILSQQGSCFGLQCEGVESSDEITGTQSSSVSLFAGEEKLGHDETNFETKNHESLNGLLTVSSDRSPKNVKAEKESSSLISPEGHHENKSAVSQSVNGGSGTHANDQPIYGRKTKILEMDVEKVIEEQETHDLFCPNCHSCITKRVILRKRKRVIQDSQDDPKLGKIQPVLEPVPEADPDPVVSSDPSHETEPDVFTCLSCFSFFIPTATGFKLFGRNDGKSLQTPRQGPPKNSISSIFELVMGKRAGSESVKDTMQSDKEVEQPLLSSQHLDESVNLHSTTGTTSSMGVGLLDISSSYIGENVENATTKVGQHKQNGLVLLKPGSSLLPETQNGDGEKLDEVKPKSAGHGSRHNGERNKDNLLSSSSYSNDTWSDDKTTTTATNPSSELADTLVSSGGKHVDDPEPKPLENENANLNATEFEGLLNGERKPDTGEILEEVPQKNAAGMALVDTFVSGGGKHVDDPEPKPLEDENANLISTEPEGLLNRETKPDIGEILEEVPQKNAAVAGLIEPIEGAVKPVTLVSYQIKEETLVMTTPVTLVSSQIKEETLAMTTPGVVPETRIDMGQQQRVDEAGSRDWDILKSIVYGGLTESITSLGVISSAAGTNASTLNIVVLGLTNLISGLFVLVHSLRVLKNDQHTSDEEEGKVERYYTILGRKENFRLHTTIAVLSYLIFGLLPPVIYGFSFRKSDNKDYKLIALAASSLLCIAVLAIGKAHVGNTPKKYVKTLFYFIILGVIASGLSYEVGVLLKKLLVKLGWFVSSATTQVSSSNLAFPETIAMNSWWASN